MNPARALALALDPALILEAQGLAADRWQRAFLLCPARYVLLNCSRGAGKTRVTSALALHTALFRPGALVVLVSRALRQAGELLRYCKQGNRALGRPVTSIKENEHLMELSNGSRIVSLPGREETIRSFQGVNLLVIDEAARVPDDLYASVSPMTGTAGGRTVCLSTPFGQRGFFWREWHAEGSPWVRFRVPWTECPRLTADFIEEERRKFGAAWVAQEYECDFTLIEGLVYPDFEALAFWSSEFVVARFSGRGGFAPTEAGHYELTGPQGAEGRQVGGIDFGFRNPFAAVWGTLDADDVLHLSGERYVSAATLDEHARALPRGYLWYADPAGASEIAGLRAAGHKVRAGPNAIRAGIAAVTARLRTGRLKVHNCPHLLAEARLYRYPSATERQEGDENPVDENNHALAALRYLVMGIDGVAPTRAGGAKPVPDEAPPVRASRPRLDDPAIWQ